MDRWERAKVGAGIGLACGVMAGSLWIAGKIMAPIYPEQRGYAVNGVPPVDLAAAQRDWPVGGNPAERAELLGYIGRIENAVVPAVAEDSTVASPAPADLGTLLASADADRGRRSAQVCLACHDFSPNGPNRIGPNLWGVVGRPVAGHAGFAYSPALHALGGEWTYEQLDRFLAGPSRAVPGTKMAFAGFRNPRERANLIAYLATMGANKTPFPQPQSTPEAAQKTATLTP